MRLFCTQRHVAMTHFKPAVVRVLMSVLHTYTPQGEAAKASSRRRRTLSSNLYVVCVMQPVDHLEALAVAAQV
jgi:hypothetical protein